MAEEPMYLAVANTDVKMSKRMLLALCGLEGRFVMNNVITEQQARDYLATEEEAEKLLKEFKPEMLLKIRGASEAHR